MLDVELSCKEAAAGARYVTLLRNKAVAHAQSRASNQPVHHWYVRYLSGERSHARYPCFFC